MARLGPGTRDRRHGAITQAHRGNVIPDPDSTRTTGSPRCPLFCRPFSYKQLGGCDWRQERHVQDLVFATVESYAPNFRASIFGHSSLSPLDLEEKLGLAGGNIFHGALGLDQLWAARPMLGYGDYRTPLKCLYLCGSGAHPGGGVTGLPGHNAAREILRNGLSKTLAALIGDNWLVSPQTDTK